MARAIPRVRLVFGSPNPPGRVGRLSYKYALLHYAEKGLPTWLVRFPLRAVS